MFVSPHEALRVFEGGEPPAALGAFGDLTLEGPRRAVALPQELSVHGNLTIINVPGLTALPDSLAVKGDLTIADCPDLERFPTYLRVGESVRVERCPALRAIRCSMAAGGDVDFGNCGALGVFIAAARIRGSLGFGATTSSETAPGNPLKILAGTLDVGGDLVIRGMGVRSLPANMRIGGSLDATSCRHLARLGAGLTVGGDLILVACHSLQSLGAGLKVGRDAVLSCILGDAFALPKDAAVGGLRLVMIPHLREIPDGLAVSGSLHISGCPEFARIGNHVTVGGSLVLSRNDSLKELPEDLKLGGSVKIEKCAALESLSRPSWVVNGDLTVRDCPALGSLPDALEATGTLEITGCALSHLPSRLSVGWGIRLGDFASIRSLPYRRLTVSGGLELMRCPMLETLAEGLVVKGSLRISECGALRELPAGLLVAGDLDVSDCANLSRMPEGLFVGHALAGSLAHIWTLPVNCFVSAFRNGVELLPPEVYRSLQRPRAGLPTPRAETRVGNSADEAVDWRELSARFGPDVAKPLDMDPDEKVGMLVAIERPPVLQPWEIAEARDPLCLLRVRCATTGRYHLLRVPPSCRTAREANAWTFGFSAEEYRPRVEA